ncbi:MAG: hypothetical protein LJE93_00130 [Acidobacteria bacterium]|nr:hypothetical protein [Acidobacteriota bacterium]
MAASLVSGYPWVLVGVGILAVVLGINRTFNRKKKESDFLKALGLIGGIVTLALPILIVMSGEQLTWFSPITFLVMVALGLCLCARPLRKLPVTFIVVGIVGVGLFVLFLNLRNTEFAGATFMTVAAVFILAILAGLFLLGLYFEKSIDFFLRVLGLGPVVAITGVIATIFGLGAAI